MTGKLGCDPLAYRFNWNRNGKTIDEIFQNPLQEDVFSVPPQCQAQLVETLNHLAVYDRSAWEGNHSQARNEFRSIQDTLERLRTAENVCFKPVASAYAIATLVVPYPYTFSALMASDHHEADKKSIDSFRNLPIFGLDRAARLASALAKAGVLEPWRMDRKELGAYECERSRIYFDYRISPLDLGGVILHEMDHFLRDKLDIQLRSSGWTVEDILTDEILASTLGGFHEAT